MGTILLFYKYIHIDNPQQILSWQKQLCQDLGLKGRVIIAHEGINATVGGTHDAIAQYKAAVAEHPLFGGIDFKESPGVADCFPRMRVVVKNEIVHLGLDTNTVVATDGGKHLNPTQVHELLSNKPEDLVILDARNTVESQVGTFAGAITPAIETFRELPEYINTHEEQFSGKQVLMFCTGGVRCERASAFLKSKGITKEVYQLEGGIHRYIEQFPDGFFRGKNYVFDGRMTVAANADILGSCAVCGIKYDEYANCLNASCNKHFIGCPDCLEKLDQTCSTQCQQLVADNAVPRRPERTTYRPEKSAQQ